jgi:alkaline phosphatase
MQSTHEFSGRIGRRAFLQNGALVLSAGVASSSLLQAKDDNSSVSFGLITDLHYADKPPAGSRHYRETPDKLAEVADKFAHEKPAFIVELGDFIDAAASVETELGYLKRINRDFAAISKDRHYVLGNHCVDMLKKDEFLGGVERDKSYYSFDSGGVHFVVLDSCFRSDGKSYGRKNFQWTDPNVPAAELDWLTEDLKATSKPTIVFAHQRLDVSNHYGVKNASAVRGALEGSGNVLSVFQGHSHKNDHKEIGGIHYCTMVAMVEGMESESNGYSLVKIGSNRTIEISGFRKQASYDWPTK